MASTEEAVRTETKTLQDLARRHLWMHFTRMGAYDGTEIPIIVGGEGCYVYDEHGKRYLDALSALFCVNIGHGRADIAQAGADQAKDLGFFSNWSYAHPPAIRLAARIAALAPGDLTRVFFTSGGSEAVESALKLARQYYKLRGKATKHKLIAREVAYHGTSLGALSATGVTGLREPFEPLAPGGCHVPNTNTYRLPLGIAEDRLADTIAERIEFEGADTVAAVILEPVQNAGGCITPPGGYFQRVRDLPIVGDVRGAGYFQAIELVKDKETKESFSDEEAEVLLRGFLSGELYRRGLICRADDRGDPVIQLSPPLIAGPEQFAEIESVLRPVLEEAGERMHVHTG
jgi:adenosylmethionine-8-amino-7-oxononanoate aminotransferase